MPNLKLAIQLCQNMGARYVVYRVRHEIERRLGWLKKNHPTSLQFRQPINKEQWKISKNNFVIGSREELTIPRNQNPLLKEKAQRILHGQIPFFNAEWKDLGKNYDWVTNPSNGYRYDITKHWSEAGKALKDTNVLFLLIGQGMEKARLIKLAEKIEVKNVRFIDSVPKKEVFKYIIASEMGASVLKRVDTFKTVYSNKTFDYFSCKKPILMAIDGVSRELVETAKAGTYVEPENTNEYNRIIREYLNNQQRLIEEGENGYQYAKQNFDRAVLANQYIEKIKQIINFIVYEKHYHNSRGKT